MKEITKSFPGVKALQDVSMVIQTGEVHALLGENGAGKSTLIKILSGLYRKDSGEIWMDGKRVEITDARHAQTLGISVIPQEVNLVPEMTVAENIALGREDTGRCGLFDRRRTYEKVRETLERLGFDIDIRRRVYELSSVSEQRLIEIARALYWNATTIIMDEPTAALPTGEVKKLFSIIRRLKESNVTVLYISHRLEEVFEVADRVTVLRDGKVVGSFDKAELDMKTLITLMVGKEVGREFPVRVKAPTSDVVLSVRNLSSGVLSNISFDLHYNEILGLAGTMGAGRSELLRVLAGYDRIERGDLRIQGEPVGKSYNPARAIRRGVGFVTEDRKGLSLALKLSIGRNIELTDLRSVSSAGLVRPGIERTRISGAIASFNVKPPFPNYLCKELSGGNQQKVSIAKAFFSAPKILLFDEPTKGIDVGAKSEMYELIRRSVDEMGVSVIIASSELPELLGICDRIIVLYRGSVVKEFQKDEFSQEDILLAASKAG